MSKEEAPNQVQKKCIQEEQTKVATFKKSKTKAKHRAEQSRAEQKISIPTKQFKIPD